MIFEPKKLKTKYLQIYVSNVQAQNAQIGPACSATKRFNGPPYLSTLSQKSLKIKYVQISLVQIYVSNVNIHILK